MRRTFTAVIERDADTGYYFGFIPGVPGAHTQAESLDELNGNLKEVVEMLFENGEPAIEAEFIGTQLVEVG
jgi:predicted RNase H-like HicB family nuclease